MAGLTVLLGALLVGGLLIAPRDADRIRELVDAAGTLAAPAFVGAGALLILAFFPFPVVAAAGGLLFGVAAGTMLSLLWPRSGGWRRSARWGVAGQSRPRVARPLWSVRSAVRTRPSPSRPSAPAREDHPGGEPDARPGPRAH